MYDCIIIGGGIVGFTAAMYAGRLGLKTIILEGEIAGGTIITTDIVENWPGIKKISGEDLAKKVIEHAKEYPVEIEDTWIVEIKKEGKKGCFTVMGEVKKYSGKTVIIATGAKHRKHPCKGAGKYENKGVHYCALCDGPLYAGKNLAVIGGGDSAAKEALLLTKFAKKVILLIKGDKLRGESVNNERVKSNKKITTRTGVNVLEMKGNSKMDTIIIENKSGKRESLSIDGAFVAIGIIPSSELAVKIGVKVNRRKEIVINREASTNVEGVFACGDVTDTRFKQAITGAGEAVTAAYWAYEYVNANDYVCPHGEDKP